MISDRQWSGWRWERLILDPFWILISLISYEILDNRRSLCLVQLHYQQLIRAALITLGEGASLDHPAPIPVAPSACLHADQRMT